MEKLSAFFTKNTKIVVCLVVVNGSFSYIFLPKKISKPSKIPFAEKNFKKLLTGNKRCGKICEEKEAEHPLSPCREASKGSIL